MPKAPTSKKSAASKATPDPKSQASTKPDRPFHGRFIWNELMTHDVARAKKFYERTIGWTFEAKPVPEMNLTYWIAKEGEQMVGGIFEMHRAEFANMPEQWVGYIGVDDVDARFKKAVANGAKDCRAPFDIPGVGRVAFFREPGGAMIAIMTPKM